MKSSIIILLTCMTVAASCADEPRQHVVIVLGASGTAEYGELFRDWSGKWEAAATAGGSGCTIIGRDEESDDLTKLQQSLSEISSVESPEPLWLVLIGHGTFDGRAARFNLRGKDVAAEDLSAWVNEAKRPIIVINSASCSSPFINALSGNGRVIVSATKDANQMQFARFGGYLAEGIGTLDADVDRDGQTSLLEAWLFAARRTQEFYDSDNRLATEHSLLDDSGDGKGTRSEVFEGVRIRDDVKNRDELDGRLAHRQHLIRSEAERALTPEQRTKRDELELQLENLRQRKSDLAETDYLNELERILIPLAKIYENAKTPEDQPQSSDNNGEASLPSTPASPKAASE